MENKQNEIKAAEIKANEAKLPASPIRTDIQFKNAELNEATKKLADVYARQEKDKKDVCILLHKLEMNKSYKEDGFKSLAEFAERIGLDKSIAHKYENAGRLYDNTDETVKEFASKTDFSKLAILASADPVKVNSAIKSGDLKSDMTQEQVKQWKETVTEKKAKPEKRKTYKVIEAHIPADTGKAKKAPTATTKQFTNAIKAEVPMFDEYTFTFHKKDEKLYHVGFRIDAKGIHLALIEECEYNPEDGLPEKKQAIQNANKRAKEAEDKLAALMKALAEKGISID